jgi:LysM repeat protein
MSTDRRPRRTPSHLLAPIALIVFGIAFLLVLSGGGGESSDSGTKGTDTAAEKRDLGSAQASERKQRRKKTSTTKAPSGDVYVVKQGDTLAGIAETTSVPVERLQELNPGLDQFSLVAGQRIKLR